MKPEVEVNKKLVIYLVSLFCLFLYRSSHTHADDYDTSPKKADLNSLNIADTSTTDLTPEQKKYLSNTAFRRYHIDEWMPLNFSSSDGEYIGIAEDYWQLIKSKLQLKESLQGSVTFAELLELMKQKKVDIYPATARTKDREEYALFSIPYESYSIAIATRPNYFLSNAASLSGRTVAVGKNYSTYHLMKAKHPDINYLQVRNTKEAIQKVMSGEAYAAVDILPVLQYHIHNSGNQEVVFAGVTDISFPMAVMIHKDHRQLLPIINKAINSITLEERTAISKKWVKERVIQKADYGLFLSVSFLSLVVIGLITFWNRIIAKANRQVERSNLRLKLLDEELKAKNQELEKIAGTDVLTGLCNRLKLDAALKNEIDRADRYSLEFGVALADIDNFKRVNDSYGHQIGDDVLVGIADVLQNNLRKTDIAGRWGGEEFLIICPGTSANDMLKLIESLRVKIEQYDFPIAGKQTVSVGITSYFPLDSAASITKRADQALYEAKGAGKNKVTQYVFSVPAER
ncbi:diguanylate cyclase (ggdef domain) [gamma proteobacterium NOR5-3]|nr:diguanylate cyclase (ggdef domain) [gamma proteobacterium NOR5-3]